MARTKGAKSTKGAQNCGTQEPNSIESSPEINQSADFGDPEPEERNIPSAGYWDSFEADWAHNDSDLLLEGDHGGTPQPNEWAEYQDPNSVPPLKEGQIWIRQHPVSCRASGFLSLDEAANQAQGQVAPLDEILPPHFPFKSLDDFLQAEIFSNFGDTDKKIDCQLGLACSKVTLKSAKDYHETLALAIRLWGGEFTSKKFVTTFEGQEFEHHVHFQPVFPALEAMIGDPDLSQYMVYFPEERWEHRPGTDNSAMQVWEELHHAKLWWSLQSQIQSNQHVLYIVVYIDETHVSTIGGVQVWPVYGWIGNLPALIRRRRTKKGGAILFGYLPKARNDSKVKDLAGFRCKVYHDAINIIFESLKLPSRYGAPIRCGDGIVREFVPVVAAGSADYMEIIRMICILGHRSDFPCPICLVPRLEQSDLMKSWPVRTASATEEIFARAETAESLSESDRILREQSFRNVRSAFLDIIPPIHSIYGAIIADPLHQIEQGIWGKHLWPWIRDQLPTASKLILDNRIRSIPRYPDLKHFPNGITGLKYVTGKEHGVILRSIAPLLDDLISDEYRKVVLGTFRTLATIHMLVKFTTHTDVSLEELGQQIRKFNRLHAKLVQTFPDALGGNYPKFHSLSHLVEIIQRHGTTDNYHTGLGEALHPQSKKDYRRTNHQQDFEIQMLRMHQEREIIIRIRARIDASKTQDRKMHDLDSTSSWDGPAVQLGSSDRNGRQSAPVFVKNYLKIDRAAHKMGLNLRTFLYQEIGGFGNRIHFREMDLPLLDGMLISVFRLVTVGYTSLLDSRLGLDVARVTDSWRKQGPRHDYVLVDTGRETFVGQLLKVFTLKARGELNPVAYIRRFNINRRSKVTGCIKLKDTELQYFIRTDWIVRSCVVFSPGITRLTHILWDLESPDMYLRLKHL
ncbi:hypothetical protein RSAG8_06711, partial [Rhizoctonia solani AG-8 WAC10335]